MPKELPSLSDPSYGWVQGMMVHIFIEFTRKNGHEHPQLRTAVDNYLLLLRKMGKSEQEIETLKGGMSPRVEN